MATIQPKTPGVYINEPDSFPPSIVGVETAVPAFIGYTARAAEDRKAVTGVPVRIGSMADYERVFGGAFRKVCFLSSAPAGSTDRDLGKVTLDEGRTTYHLVESGEARFYLYDSLRHFYANGGGDCYVVSVANYAAADGTPTPLAAADLIAGLDAVKNVIGPTMLLVPDALLLARDGYDAVIQHMLQQCGDLGDRVALFDILGGDAEKWDGADPANPVALFREAVAGQQDRLKYGIAYFPFIRTSIVQPAEVRALWNR